MTRRQGVGMTVAVLAVCAGVFAWWLGGGRTPRPAERQVQMEKATPNPQGGMASQDATMSETPSPSTQADVAALQHRPMATRPADLAEPRLVDRSRERAPGRPPVPAGARLADLAAKMGAQARSSPSTGVAPDWLEFRRNHPTTQGLRIFADRPHRPYPLRGGAAR